MNEQRLGREGALNPGRGSTRRKVTEASNSLRSFLTGIRPLFLNHMDAWGTAVVIAVLAIRVHGGSDWKSSLLILGIGSLYWVGFAFNDFHDAPDDALDPPKGSRNFFVIRTVSTRWAAVGLGVISLALLFVFGYFGWPGLVLLALSLGIMWAYSAPPLRLKNRAGLDLLTHAIFIQSYPYLLVILLLGLTWSRLDTVLWTILFLSSLAAQLEQQAGDSWVDAQTGSNFTTTVGLRTAVFLMKAISIGVVLLFSLYFLTGTIPLFVLPMGLLSLPLIIHRFRRDPGIRRPVRSSQATLFLMLIYTMILYISGWVL